MPDYGFGGLKGWRNDLINSNVIQAVTFALNASLSNKFFVPAGSTIVSLDSDAAWTAADLYFTICDTQAGSYWDVYNSDGTAYTILSALMVAGKRRYLLPPADLASLGGYWVQLRSGPSGAAVNQLAARSLTVVTKPV